MRDEVLERCKAVLPGWAALNVDDNRDPERPVHTSILRAGIPIVEHLCGLEEAWDQARSAERSNGVLLTPM